MFDFKRVKYYNKENEFGEPICKITLDEDNVFTTWGHIDSQEDLIEALKEEGVLKMEIKRAQFILMVVNHFENRRVNPHHPWTVDDSFVYIAEELDLADMDQKEYNKLLADCKENTNNYLKLDS